VNSECKLSIVALLGISLSYKTIRHSQPTKYYILI